MSILETETVCQPSEGQRRLPALRQLHLESTQPLGFAERTHRVPAGSDGGAEPRGGWGTGSFPTALRGRAGRPKADERAAGGGQSLLTSRAIAGMGDAETSHPLGTARNYRQYTQYIQYSSWGRSGGGSQTPLCSLPISPTKPPPAKQDLGHVTQQLTGRGFPIAKSFSQRAGRKHAKKGNICRN